MPCRGTYYRTTAPSPPTPARCLVFDTIHGLPAHVLLIHVVVVLLPLGALFTVLAALWPAARRKLGFLTPLTCLVALVFVPISVSAGKWYRDKITALNSGTTPAAISKHQHLGQNLVWFAIGLFVVSAAVYLLGRTGDRAAVGAAVPDGYGPTGGGTATALATRVQAAKTVWQQTWLTYAVAAASIVMSALAVWWVYRVGDSGAQAVYGTGG